MKITGLIASAQFEDNKDYLIEIMCDILYDVYNVPKELIIRDILEIKPFIYYVSYKIDNILYYETIYEDVLKSKIRDKKISSIL